MAFGGQKFQHKAFWFLNQSGHYQRTNPCYLNHSVVHNLMQTPSYNLAGSPRTLKSGSELTFPRKATFLNVRISKAAHESHISHHVLCFHWDDENIPSADPSLTAEMHWADAQEKEWDGTWVVWLGAMWYTNPRRLTLDWGFPSGSISSTSYKSRCWKWRSGWGTTDLSMW